MSVKSGPSGLRWLELRLDGVFGARVSVHRMNSRESPICSEQADRLGHVGDRADGSQGHIGAAREVRVTVLFMRVSLAADAAAVIVRVGGMRRLLDPRPRHEYV
jgi:hypothetical protein